MNNPEQFEHKFRRRRKKQQRTQNIKSKIIDDFRSTWKIIHMKLVFFLCIEIY